MKRTHAAIVDGVYLQWEEDAGPVKVMPHAEGAAGLGLKQRARSTPIGGFRAGSGPTRGNGNPLGPCVQCGRPTRSERCLVCVGAAERERGWRRREQEFVERLEAEAFDLALMSQAYAFEAYKRRVALRNVAAANGAAAGLAEHERRREALGLG